MAFAVRTMSGVRPKRGISADEIQRIRSTVEPIASKRGGFSGIYLFGSRARGDGKQDSDYDFCICPDDDVCLLKLAGLLDELTKGLSGDVDIVDATASEPGSAFLSEIERDGILKYER